MLPLQCAHVQAAVTATQLHLTRKDLAASQLMCVGQAGQINQQGQDLAELSSRVKQLEAQVLEAQQQVGRRTPSLPCWQRTESFRAELLYCLFKAGSTCPILISLLPP
jgi:hypothetical protein